MDISRHASMRYRGKREIISNLRLDSNESQPWRNAVTWDEATNRIEIKAGYVLHEDGVTHHNYIIYLTLEDVAALVTLFGYAGSESNAGLLRKLLEAHIPALVKLLACATGLVPVPIKNDSE